MTTSKLHLFLSPPTQLPSLRRRFPSACTGMSSAAATTTTTTFLVVVILLATPATISCKRQANVDNETHYEEAVRMARAGVEDALTWARAGHSPYGSGQGSNKIGLALGDCAKLYEEAGPRLERLESGHDHTREDAITWLSGALASHSSCLDGLEEKGLVAFGSSKVAQNLTLLVGKALALFGTHEAATNYMHSIGEVKTPNPNQIGGLLATWDATKSKADIVVSKDGSGNYKTINEAVADLSKISRSESKRTVVYVKAGVYDENVEIKSHMKNVMFVGDGIDKTIVTGNRNVVDGATTLNSATFGVSGDGFWARDMTFENTAGPHKHQAVALKVASDLSVFYRCSFRGYQDTLYVHSLRQFYRECHIYGTIDFIFGDSSTVLQNCHIFVRKPMDHQSNMITAQGRDNPNQNTGISIVNSRVAPAAEFAGVKDRFKSFLGRPWKRYSRTVFLKTDLDGLIHPKGWKEWSGDYALSTLYYGEYMNSGVGASTTGRVNWPGFHVIKDQREAAMFTPRRFVQGDMWIPATGVPFTPDV